MHTVLGGQLVLLLIGAMLFAHWFYYVVGTPLAARVDDINVTAMLSFIPYLLARRRLKGAMLDAALEFWRQEHQLANDPHNELLALREHRRNVIRLGREFFTWEKVFLCPVCLHWWLSLQVTWTWVVIHGWQWHAVPVAALTYLFTHLIIRKL